ncbi:hypothetical protein [Sandaracinobacteroides saxicola]|uniref:DUF4345 domain-containing protein n=1 Tax=Sandaracinobacteroides saxicola TaxID=2759707 RepID=A0A7G5IFY1_9SPHN|nr:hypothetical protein [Sandaracinobacteroides saxicola]QMW22273.1 hypothetical protein H3309_13040 [Sandaracinobacteroides saxicola]
MTLIARTVAALLALFCLGVGGYQLAAPLHFWFNTPGVVGTGGFNAHFIRDIGIIYVISGGLFLVGLFSAAQRPLAFGTATAWLAGHALFHGAEVAVGICGVEAIPRDFPGVTLPALLAAAVTLHSLRRPA